MSDASYLNSCNKMIPTGDSVLRIIGTKMVTRTLNSFTHQLAFVPERSILDNAMVAIEVVHYMRTKTTGKAGCVALKLDINKPYDRMSWEYLRAVLARMGFSDKWVH
jgi:hypothetical protein